MFEFINDFKKCFQLYIYAWNYLSLESVYLCIHLRRFEINFILAKYKYIYAGYEVKFVL